MLYKNSAPALYTTMESTIWNFKKYPRTFIILFICVLLCIPSYFNYQDAEFWSVASNIAYVVPLLISIEVKTYTFTILFAVVILISSFYHACQTYEACIYNLDNSMAIDVLFSWLLLLTLMSYVAFKKYYYYLVIVNFLIVVLTHEAHCSVTYLGYDCEFVKMIIVGMYLVIIFIKNIKEEIHLDATDTIVGLICFAFAFFFYATYSEDDKQTHYGHHALWHVLGAAAGALVLTIYKDEKIHLWGWVRGDIKRKDEGNPLIRSDI